MAKAITQVRSALLNHRMALYRCLMTIAITTTGPKELENQSIKQANKQSISQSINQSI